MNSFGSYFKRHFLSSWVRTVFFTVIGVITLVAICSNEYMEWKDKSSDILIITSYFNQIVIFSTVLSILLPILEFSQFNNKNHLDTLYSLPISRTKLFLVHYLNGFLQIALSLLVMFLVWYFGWVLSPVTNLHSGYPWFALPSILFLVLIIYTFYTFVFLQANSIIDGCIYMVLYTVLFAMIFLPLSKVFPIMYDDGVKPTNLFDDFAENCFPYLIAIIWGKKFDLLISPIPSYATKLPGQEYVVHAYEFLEPDAVFRFETTIVPYCLLVFFLIITIICFIVTIKSFKNRLPERIDEISDSWFGYRTLIPIYSVTCVKFAHMYINFAFGAPILTFIGYLIYNRSIRLKTFDIAVISCSVLLAIVQTFL